MFKIVIIQVLLLLAYISCSMAAGVEDYVRQVIRSRLYYQGATNFSHADAKKLIAMLADEKEAKWHANIVTTLGIIGSPEAFPALKTFFENVPPADIDRNKLSALMAVPEALANMAAHTNALIETYLIDYAHPSTWKNKTVGWTFRGRLGLDQFRDVFNSRFIRALAIASTHSCDEALAGLLQDPTVDKAWRPVISEAIAFSEVIRSRGRMPTLFKGHFDDERPSKITPSTSDDSRKNSRNLLEGKSEKEIADLALAAYTNICLRFVTGGLPAIVTNLADNGKAVIPVKEQTKEKIAVIVEIFARKPQNAAIPRAIMDDLVREHCAKGAFTVKTNAAGIVVTWPWISSEGIGKKHLQFGGSPETQQDSGQLMVYMLYSDGNWFWNPYGW